MAKKIQLSDDARDLELIKRRNFLTGTVKFGLTTAVVAAGAGTLVSSEAMAITAKEEKERKKAAKYKMVIGTQSTLGSSRGMAAMQLDFKENIQNMTNGEIYVALGHSRKFGVGKVLANKVQKGVIHCGQHSISNLAPFCPPVDLINIPYWSAKNQRYVSLVTSQVWKNTVDPKLAKAGFKVLWYPSNGARTFSVRKGNTPILKAGDMRGLKFRVPGSPMLKQFVRLLGANPTPVAWGETPSAMKQGVADALDVTLTALWNAKFHDILGHITFAHSVHGGQVYSCNIDWYNSLSGKVRERLDYASDVTARQAYAKMPAAESFAKADMMKSGVKFHDLSDDAMAEVKKLAGHQRPEYDQYKIKFAGSLANFDKLNEAAQQINPRYIIDSI
ncbi:MAG: TRAP transporter substrate-binding protein [Porticoccaceae bacterium]|nr:TRAP transporter substrate-binding protein [Porticoccaceae bacterium]|tara:strand:+ start:5034 stop:6200 length:1167 start_codon:yes stop_codon:yes gene_type:complete